jgi:hypothetical protein
MHQAPPRTKRPTSGFPALPQTPPLTVRIVEQERLAIVRYNCVAVEYVRGLSKRQIIGYLAEVPTVFPFRHPDAFEQESLPCHLQTHGRHIPVARDNFCLPNFEVASLVQMSQ